MDDIRFDALTRRLRSRRAALAGLLGGLTVLVGLRTAADAVAHDPVPACKKIADPTKRRACLRRARRHNRRQHSCTSQPRAITCANRCGTVRNNCKRPVTCTCPTGKACLANFDCTRTCALTPSVPCPLGCSCGIILAENPAIAACVPTGTAFCSPTAIPCVTSANCPLGYFCGDLSGSCPTDQCIPSCPV